MVPSEGAPRILTLPSEALLVDFMVPKTQTRNAQPQNFSTVQDHAAVVGGTVKGTPTSRLDAALLTGGKDAHYAFGVATSLASAGVYLDVIGNDDLGSLELRQYPKLRFLNLRGSQKLGVGFAEKILRVVRYYGRLIGYATSAKPRVFHILWNNKFEFFDRSVLMLYYKILGKKVVLTAHNVNAGKRDANDSVINRLGLRIQYRLADHIFVHTEKMKGELMADFGVSERAITTIPYGINNAIPDTEITRDEARRRCGVGPTEKTILFFGEIAPYKGLDTLVRAFWKVLGDGHDYRLIIAGRAKGEREEYIRHLQIIQEEIRNSGHCAQVTQKIQFIPDEEMELYFKAADLLVLPYRQIFQSGILFLAFSFGLPVVASDVGCFRDDVIEGETGFLCKPGDPFELAECIEKYFRSDLFFNLARNRRKIKERVSSEHSWDVVAQMTRQVYEGLVGK